MKSLTTLFCVLIFTATTGQTGKILSGFKTLTYRAEYIDSINNICIRDTVRFTTTNMPWKRDPKQQVTVVWKYSGLRLHDSIKKKLFSINWRDDVDSTGAIEASHEYWIHPARSKHYTITEIAPFPAIEFPCAIGRKFNHTLQIFGNWGPWSNLTLYNIYEIIGKDSIIVGTTTYECWVTIGRNDSQLGTSFLITKFDDKIGFVDFNYSFYNKTRLRLELIKVEQR